MTQHITQEQILSAFDDVVAIELPRVSHVQYDSHEICKHFANNLRTALCDRAALAQPASEPKTGISVTGSGSGMSPETIQRVKKFLHQHKTSSPNGICPACDGEGEQGGQFSGGSWTCEACNGTGVAAPTGEPG